MLTESKILAQTYLKPPALWQIPSWLGLEVTTRCNSSCRTCRPLQRRAQTRSKDTRILSLKQFEQIFKAIKPRILSLAGAGENLLNPEYFEMIKVAVAHKTKVYSTTNGILLKEYAEKAVASGIDELVISMDGYDEKSYYNIRGADAFSQVLAGIEEVHKVKGRTGNGRLIIGFNVVVQDINYEHLVDIIDLAYRYRVSIVNFLPLDICHGYLDNQRYVDLIDCHRLSEALESAGKRSRRHKISTNLSIWKHHFEAIWNKMHLGKTDTLTRKPCHHPWSSIFINSEGDVLPCCILVDDRFNYGNIFDTSLLDIINSEKAVLFRKKLINGEKPLPRCRECIVIPFGRMVHDMFRRKLLTG